MRIDCHGRGIGRSSGDRRRKLGFSLAEVVVAAVLLGLVATVLGRAVADALNAYSKIRMDDPYEYPAVQVRAHILERLNRTELETGGELDIPLPRRDAQSGGVQTETIRARWEAEIFPTRILDLFLVEYSVVFHGGEEEAAQASDRLMLFRPMWADSEETRRLIEAKEEEFKTRIELRDAGERSES
jgi:hypothetical protein